MRQDSVLLGQEKAKSASNLHKLYKWRFLLDSMNWRNIQIFGLKEYKPKIIAFIVVILAAAVAGAYLFQYATDSSQSVPLPTTRAVQDIPQQEQSRQSSASAETAQESASSDEDFYETLGIDLSQYPGTCAGDVRRAAIDVSQTTNQAAAVQQERDRVQQEYDAQLQQIETSYQPRLVELQRQVEELQSHADDARGRLTTVQNSCALAS